MGKREKNIAYNTAYTKFAISYLREEAQSFVDRHGYEFLKKHGFNVEGAESSVKVRQRLAKEMEKKRTTLQYYAVSNEAEHSNTIYFELVVNGKVVDRSEGAKLIYIRGGENAGEEKAGDDTQGAS